MSFQSINPYIQKDPMFWCLSVYSILYPIICYFIDSRTIIEVPNAEEIQKGLCNSQRSYLLSEPSYFLNWYHFKDLCTVEDVTLHSELGYKNFVDGAVFMGHIACICNCLKYFYSLRNAKSRLVCGISHDGKCEKVPLHDHVNWFLVIRSIFTCCMLGGFFRSIVKWTDMLYVSTYWVFGTASDSRVQCWINSSIVSNMLDSQQFSKNMADAATQLLQRPTWNKGPYTITKHYFNIEPLIQKISNGVFYFMLVVFEIMEEENRKANLESDFIPRPRVHDEKASNRGQFEEKEIYYVGRFV